MSKATRSVALRRLTVTAMFAAVICVLSPIAIPIGAIPVSLGWLGVLITALTLPIRQSVSAVAVFLALGLCGLPVFGGANGGTTVLAGPTGGYLWSYLLAAPLVGVLCQLVHRNKPLFAHLACLCGTLVCYICGTFQYCLVTHTPPLPAFLVCVLPFIPFDILKMFLAVYLSRRIKPLL